MHLSAGTDAARSEAELECSHSNGGCGLTSRAASLNPTPQRLYRTSLHHVTANLKAAVHNMPQRFYAGGRPTAGPLCGSAGHSPQCWIQSVGVKALLIFRESEAALKPRTGQRPWQGLWFQFCCLDEGMCAVWRSNVSWDVC